MADAAAAAIATELRVRRLEDAEAFLAATRHFLIAREAEHNLLLGIAGTLVARPHIYPKRPYLAAVVRGPDVVAVGLALLLTASSSPRSTTRPQWNCSPRTLPSSIRTLPSVFGPKEASRGFAELWACMSGHVARKGMAQRAFRAESVKPPSGVPGAMRRAAERDHELLVTWLAAFQEEVGMGGPVRPPEEAIDDYLSRGESGGIYLWEDGQQVSLAGCGSPTPSGIRVGPVYTPPERRGRGYASALTAELTASLLAGGHRFCFLFTDLANPTSNRIYERIGYERVTDVDEYRFS